MKTNKKGHIKCGPYQTNLKLNYFVAWIANLGVVPLFRLAAFLFEPAFFFFLNLLFVVTHVLETISKLLVHYKTLLFSFNLNKNLFLPFNLLCVKDFLTSTSILLIFSFQMAISSEVDNKKNSDIIIALGQSITLEEKNLEKFNVGNKSIVHYNFNEKNKKITLRGTHLGHTEILIWNKDQSIQTYQLFIITKQQEAKILTLSREIGQIGLTSEILIPHLKIKGEIKNLNAYFDFKKILAQNQEVILDETTLNLEIKNKLFANIYKAFFNDYIDSIQCDSENSNIVCFYHSNEQPSAFLLKYVTEKYKINLIQKNNQKLKKNYKIKLKIIQLEQLDGEDIRLGLEQINSNLGEFLSLGVEKIMAKNMILLSQKNITMSTLAEPETLIRPLTPSEIQIGAEIPFHQKEKKSNNVVWKFAGLKIKINLENYGEQVKIDYETELTQPQMGSEGVNSINGNKEKSSAIVKLDSALKLFQLSMKTEVQLTDKMPFINKIPVLGEIFKSKSNQATYKTITGIIEVKEYE